MNFSEYPKAINHIAISVPDLDKALNWYQVLGFIVVRGPTELNADDPKIGNMVKDIFGADFKRLKLVWMSSSNNIGFEIFQFIDPKSVKDNKQIQYMKNGVIHISITEPNLEDLARKISETGGRPLSKIWELNQEKHHNVVFCEDPFGTIIEIYSHSFEQFHANM
jgi:catechol 2,3-dioxygenase-like lactoylglutathione lyase family enzyme